MATTTPNYGWDVPTSTDYVKDGATAIETLGDDIDATLWTALGGAYPGLRLVKKQTIGSGVSTVTVTNAFSATYENYRIVVAGGTNAGSNYINFYLGSTNTGYYNNRVAADYSSSAPANASVSNETQWYYVGHSNTDNQFFDMYLNSPFATKKTYFTSSYAMQSFGATCQGYQNSATSFTGFTLQCGTAMTGGTIYVYGYGAS